MSVQIARQATNPGEDFWIDPTSGSAEPLTLRSRPRQPGPNALDDTPPFEFSDGPEDLHLKSAGGRRCVDAHGEADERDAERLEILQQRDQVLQVAAKPIEPPADHDVEPAALGIGQKPIESGASVLRPAHPAVDILRCGPASRLDVSTEFLQLVLGFLIQR
jgi:hypothetical protein